MSAAYVVITARRQKSRGQSNVRSKGADGECDVVNHVFCWASTAFALCHRFRRHRVTGFE